MITNTRFIPAKDGRKICILEAGLPDGIPVLVLHGTPGSRLLYTSWIEDALARGIRLISYDRPGYGGSTPHPGRTVASAAEDVADIASALRLDRLLVWGVSGGGPHALTCAALLPNLVTATAVLASLAPYRAEGLDWLDGMGEANIAEFGAALENREAIEKFVEHDTSELLSKDPNALVEAWRSLLCPADVAVINQEYAGFLHQGFQVGIKERRDGWIDDDLAFISPWGFDLERIRVPVLLMHGMQDQMVPFSHGRWLANTIPHASTRLLEGDGHLTLGTRRIPEVHTWLLSKLE